MKRSKTSRAWMSEHVHDPYVQRAKAENYRSRAAFKLIEIHEKDRLFRQGMTVVDLGAAPGSWSQVALQGLQNLGKVIAVDLLEIVPMHGLTVIQGDFQEEAVLQAILSHLPDPKVDVVLSDMAPNISGIAISDQARMMNLAELALDFCLDFLKDDGVFLIKLFQGHGFDDFVRLARSHFVEVAHRKPDASRDRSSEVYLLCKKIKARK